MTLPSASGWVVFWSAALVMTLPAGAQVPYEPPTITASGSATIEAAPEYLECWLHKRVSAETFADAVKELEGLEEAITKAIEDHGLTPLETLFAAPAIPTAQTVVMTQAIRLRYGPAPPEESDASQQEYVASILDIHRELAAEVGCTLEGPRWGVTNPENVEQRAVASAVENAWPRAQGAAVIMQSTITSVKAIEAEEVQWNADPDWRGRLPEISRLTCTVKVTVTYEVAWRI